MIIKVICSSVTGHFRGSVTDVPFVDEITDRHPLEIAHERGEALLADRPVVHDVQVGDSVRWKISPSISGSGSEQTTHLIIKPVDAGLVSSLNVATNRRTYAIKLVSTQRDWMPLVAFNYPGDMQQQWYAYRQTVAFGAAANRLPTGENTANLDFGFQLSGDDPSWKPLRVYTDGAKTYIEFP